MSFVTNIYVKRAVFQKKFQLKKLIKNEANRNGLS